MTFDTTRPHLCGLGIICPKHPGYRGYGHTMDGALENIREAVELCIEDVEDEQDPEEISTTFIGIEEEKHAS